ncbi:MAG: hypothetical protein V3S30_00715, partial [Thermoanaerobaculia bacterium]
LEVCRRDTQIATAITGRVERVGSRYTLGLEAIDAGTGLATEVVSAETDQPEELLRLSRDLASRLVDSVKGRSKPELEPVTTNSLQAAQLYTLANRMLLRHNLGGKDMNAAAEELLLEAVAEDPAFASAHLLLAWAVMRQGRATGDFLPHADRALELLESATEAERFFIRGSRLSLAEEHEASIPIYQALIDRYPDHFWGTNNLSFAFYRTGRPAEEADLQVILADLRPTSLRLNYAAAHDLAMLGDSRVELFAARTRKLLAPNDWEGRWGFVPFWIESRTAHRAWLEGDLQELVSELGRLETLKDRILDAQLRQRAEAQLAFMEIGMGRLEAGRGRLEALDMDYRGRDEMLVRAAYLTEDRGALERYLDGAIARVKEHSRYTIIPNLLVRTGRLAEAEELLGELRLDREYEASLRTALALARSDPKEALDILEQAPEFVNHASTGYFLHCEVLAEAYLEMDMPRRARAVLERASKQRVRAAATVAMPAWIRNQQLLAVLYREMGVNDRATEIEAELSQLLALGDADHPIKRWLAEVGAGA